MKQNFVMTPNLLNQIANWILTFFSPFAQWYSNLAVCVQL
jgi:hypothetical protein